MTALRDIEDKIRELWERRQAVLDQDEVERQRKADHAAAVEAARPLLDEDRDAESAWFEQYDAWLADGLALFDEVSALRSDVLAHYGKPRARVPSRVRQTIVIEADRRRTRRRLASEDRAEAWKRLGRRRARELRALAKELDHARRTMAGGGGSTDQVRIRAEQARAAADVLEGKRPNGDGPDGMFVPPEVALGS